jgi:hypothetical protein
MSESAAINLSYVLHEPSTSIAVRTACEALNREHARCLQAAERIAKLNDGELARRIVVPANVDAPSIGFVEQLHVLSLQIGAWQMLPRLMRLSGVVHPSAHIDIDYLDDPDGNSMRAVPFYRTTATVNFPGRTAKVGTSLFAIAVFRPGYESVLMRFNEINLAYDHATEDDPDWESVRLEAERAIREFTYQWSCPRTLWDRPAEETLPEFHTRGNGTVVCGR